MLEARDVHKIYQLPNNRLHILKGISFRVEEGDVLSVVGPSGAGKSTLLHILGALDQPSEGQVFFEGQDVYRLKEKARNQIRNQKMGFIFQFYHLLPEFTALENVMLPALVNSSSQVSAEKIRERASSLLLSVGLNHRLQHKPHELSGGEQQRVAIARALVNEPKIIFCDEPTGNLDSESGRVIMDLLLGLNRNNRQTLVLVTHDEHIARNSNKILRMRDGALVQDALTGVSS